ncbi:MAG: flagellar hook-length control protein FliK [Solirubrobacterales bacterium]
MQAGILASASQVLSLTSTASQTMVRQPSRTRTGTKGDSFENLLDKACRSGEKPQDAQLEKVNKDAPAPVDRIREKPVEPQQNPPKQEKAESRDSEARMANDTDGRAAQDEGTIPVNQDDTVKTDDNPAADSAPSDAQMDPAVAAILTIQSQTVQIIDPGTEQPAQAVNTEVKAISGIAAQPIMEAAGKIAQTAETAAPSNQTAIVIQAPVESETSQTAGNGTAAQPQAQKPAIQQQETQGVQPQTEASPEKLPDPKVAEQPKPESANGAQVPVITAESKEKPDSKTVKTETEAKNVDAKTDQGPTLIVNSDQTKGSGKREQQEAAAQQQNQDAQQPENMEVKPKEQDVKKIIDFESLKNGLQRAETKEQVKGTVKQDSDPVNQIQVQPRAEQIVRVTAPQGMEQPQPLAVKPDAREIIRQIVDKAEVMTKGNRSTVTIDLKPDFLGKVQISLVVQDGVLTAKFSTDNQQVKQMLESQMFQLKTALDNSGIRLERTEVNVDLGGSDLSQQFQQFQQSSQYQSSQDRNNFNPGYVSGSEYQEYMSEEPVMEPIFNQTNPNDGSVNYLA